MPIVSCEGTAVPNRDIECEQGGAIAKQNTSPGKEMQLTYQEMHVFNSPGVLSCASSMVLCEGTACGVTEKKRALDAV